MKALHRDVLVISAVMLFWATSSAGIGPSEPWWIYQWAYRRADLMIIGDVVSRGTTVVRGNEPLSTAGCVRHYSVLVDVYTARVDTVLMGEQLDSMIVILSQPVAMGDSCGNGIFEVNEHGDSTLRIEVTRELRDKVDRIYRQGKHIVLIEKEGDCYVSLYTRPYRVGYGRISGRVVDEVTGEPIPSTCVGADGTDMWAITNLDGHYDILSVPPGKYDVRALMIGYWAPTQTGVRVFKDSTSTVDFFLEPRVIE